MGDIRKIIIIVPDYEHGCLIGVHILTRKRHKYE